MFDAESDPMGLHLCERTCGRKLSCGQHLVRPFLSLFLVPTPTDSRDLSARRRTTRDLVLPAFSLDSTSAFLSLLRSLVLLADGRSSQAHLPLRVRSPLVRHFQSFLVDLAFSQFDRRPSSHRLQHPDRLSPPLHPSERLWTPSNASRLSRRPRLPAMSVPHGEAGSFSRSRRLLELTRVDSARAARSGWATFVARRTFDAFLVVRRAESEEFPLRQDRTAR